MVRQGRLSQIDDDQPLVVLLLLFPKAHERTLLHLEEEGTYQLGRQPFGLFAMLMVIPFLWMLSASMKMESDVMKLPIDWIPDYLYIDNYLNVWHLGPRATTNYHFELAYLNSLKIAGINLFGAVFTSTLAGYAFAKIPFRGRDKVFLLYLTTMMVPGQVTLIPRFVIFTQLHLMGTHWPLILPMLVTITGTFLLRKYFMQVPNSLREAAIIDGASEFGTWWTIMVPLASPSMAALAMLDFLWNWNNYLDALAFLSNWRLYTIPVALTNFIDIQRLDSHLPGLSFRPAVLCQRNCGWCGKGMRDASKDHTRISSDVVSQTQKQVQLRLVPFLPLIDQKQEIFPLRDRNVKNIHGLHIRHVQLP